jgi:hypothetical protein
MVLTKCGRNFYDPGYEFCHTNPANGALRVYEKCFGVETIVCGGETTQPKCGDEHYDPAGDRFCDNNKLYTKCGESEYDPTTQRCDGDGVTIIPIVPGTPTTNYTLTINQPADGGTITSVPDAGAYPAGTQVTLTYTLTDGYQFASWSVNGAEVTSNTFTMNGNVTVTAVFEAVSVTPTDYTLTINQPANGGTITGAETGSYTAGTSITLTANPAAGYTFSEWTGSLSGTTNPNTFTLSSNMTVNATFTSQQTNCGIAADTLKIEAEDFTSKNDNIQIITAEGITLVGYIENGNSITYTVYAPCAGARMMVFRIASEYDNSFSVTVNGTLSGSVATTVTGSWSNYQFVNLSSDVQLNQGNNTVVLNFGGPVNIDYFLLTYGQAATPTEYTLTIYRKSVV